MIHCNGEPETAETATPTSDRRRAASLLDRVGRLTLRWITSLYNRWLYRAHMRLAHRFNWHWMPPCYPEGDTLLRCSWCGASYMVPKPSLPLGCCRSHPHEDMNEKCEQLTVIARENNRRAGRR